MPTLGIVTDTHIPDRSRRLNPALLARFRQENVQAILHAGDVCVPRVLSELEDIAPVHAVRGNRDWWKLRSLPVTLALEYVGVSIGLIHGHDDLSRYLKDKFRTLRYGVEEDYYVQRVVRVFPRAQVIVFGHIHLPIVRWVGSTLVFNPGTACCSQENDLTPSAGLLKIGIGGQVEAKIFALD
jgi:putative phosphoesterase